MSATELRSTMWFVRKCGVAEAKKHSFGHYLRKLDFVLGFNDARQEAFYQFVQPLLSECNMSRTTTQIRVIPVYDVFAEDMKQVIARETLQTIVVVRHVLPIFTMNIEMCKLHTIL